MNVGTSGKREFAVREKRPNSRTAEIRSYFDEFEKTGHGPVPAVWIDWLEIEGPVAPQPSAAALPVAADAGSAPGARDVIERFATRAFRGVRHRRIISIGSWSCSMRAAAWETRSKSALKEPLSVVLASPGFLYLSRAVDRTRESPAR